MTATDTGARVAPDAATSRGHLLVWDPPAAMSSVERWTCDSCQRAVLVAAGGHPYGTATTERCDQIGRAAMFAAVREKWPAMPFADIEVVYDVLSTEARIRGTRLTATVARRSYLAVEAHGMAARLGYVHLGYLAVRDEAQGVGKYRVVELTRYEDRARPSALPVSTPGRCPECFLALPTSGAACVCTS